MHKTLKQGLLLLLCLLLCLPAFGCSGKNKTVVGEICGVNVRYDELVTALYEVREEGDSEAEILEKLNSFLKEKYAVLPACKAYLPALSIDDASVTEAVKEAFSGASEAAGGKDAFLKMLEESHYTESAIKRDLALSQMEILLEEEVNKDSYLANTNAFEAWLKDGNYVRVRKISFPEGKATEASNFAKAINASSDFDIEPQAADKNASVSAASYIVRGMEEIAGEDEILALAVGKAYANGLTVYLCMEPEPDRMAGQTTAFFNALRQKETEKVILSYRDQVQITWNESFRKLNLSDIF